jgi:uncharacterized protein YdaU (DUF1376 family)
MQYFPLYPGDYLQDTRLLTTLEHGAYFQLLILYYNNGGPISSDLDGLWRSVGARTDAEKEAFRYVLDSYFQLDGEVYRQKRCDREIAEYARKQKTASDNGKKGAEARKLKHEALIDAASDGVAKPPLRVAKPPLANRIEQNRTEQNITEDINTDATTSGRFDTLNFLEANGADTELAKDWLKVRKNGRATNTERAMNAFLAQVGKAGLDINTVLEICVERSWKGFQAEWLQKSKAPFQQPERTRTIRYFGESP